MHRHDNESHMGGDGSAEAFEKWLISDDSAPPPDIETAEDRMDAWLQSDASKVPGGVYIVYPAETSDRPVEVDGQARALFEEHFMRALGEVAVLTQSDLEAYEQEAREFLDNQYQ